MRRPTDPPLVEAMEQFEGAKRKIGRHPHLTRKALRLHRERGQPVGVRPHPSSSVALRACRLSPPSCSEAVSCGEVKLRAGVDGVGDEASIRKRFALFRAKSRMAKPCGTA
jgi:hypothetical protein